MIKQVAIRTHEITCGHSVFGHEGKCKQLHAHRYVFHFYCEADQLDSVGRVIDFGDIKTKLCNWLDKNWDGHFLLWEKDSRANSLLNLNPKTILTPFNPTAENIGTYFLTTIGPKQLNGTGVKLQKIVIEETRKCHVEVFDV